MNKLKDIIYEWWCNFFLNNERNPKNSIDSNKFVNLIKEKSNYDDELLK